MSCDVSEGALGLENELWCRWSNRRGWRRRLCSFSNLSVASPTSQLVLLISKPFRRFIYIRTHYPTLLSLHPHHNLFSNPSVASPMSHALHLCHLPSRPWARTPVEPNCRYATEINWMLVYYVTMHRNYVLKYVFYMKIKCKIPARNSLSNSGVPRIWFWGGLAHGRLARWHRWSACDVGEATKGLENKLWRRWSDGRVG